ncbi:acyl carrier protein [Corallococcus sp. Z5C101001]|uniref:acyl carrier protein n=1 Tax=Corallococcus sp. Z5C101001 TaxID=2596829 RepID=UPI00210654DB|nr:hypothetical protein [Corallococcus sp. Z5C101001]
MSQRCAALSPSFAETNAGAGADTLGFTPDTATVAEFKADTLRVIPVPGVGSSVIPDLAGDLRGRKYSRLEKNGLNRSWRDIASPTVMSDVLDTLTLQRKEQSMQVDINELKAGLKSMIVDRLRLSIAPASIPDGAPLFGSGTAEFAGLALDSVEALEIVVGIEEKWGVVIADDSVSKEFYSIDTLAALVSRLLAEGGKKAASA